MANIGPPICQPTADLWETAIPRAALILGSVLVVTQPTPAQAWGDLGHEIICEIAFQELSRTARRNVKRLMKLDEEYKLFSKSCRWPDHPRIRPAEHFVNLKRDSDGIKSDPCPIADKCVITAILNDMRDLALREDNKERLRLLKSLGHWVGNIHQPVHVSFKDDKGGNKIDVDSPCYSNLHAVWDKCIIKEAIGRDGRKVAIELRAEISNSDLENWAGNVDRLDKKIVIGWANESFEIATRADVEYCVQKDGMCRYTIDEKEFAGTVKDVNADMAYLTKHAPTVRMRLKMAGVRLAAILNEVLGR